MIISRFFKPFMITFLDFLVMVLLSAQLEMLSGLPYAGFLMYNSESQFHTLP